MIFDVVLNFLNKPLFEGWPTDYIDHVPLEYSGQNVQKVQIFAIFASLLSDILNVKTCKQSLSDYISLEYGRKKH